MSALAAQFGPALLVAALAAPLIVPVLFLMAALRGLASAITPLAATPALAAAALAIAAGPFGAEWPALRVSLARSARRPAAPRGGAARLIVSIVASGSRR